MAELRAKNVVSKKFGWDILIFEQSGRALLVGCSTLLEQFILDCMNTLLHT